MNAAGVLILYILSQLQEVCCEFKVSGILLRRSDGGNIDRALRHSLALGNTHFPAIRKSSEHQKFLRQHETRYTGTLKTW
ncbi:MAG TPA: hypothetical protein VFW28_14850 [Micropepsaceae bacterium]|nr:hypothetical protein [Micropepsaceae bacterium]